MTALRDALSSGASLAVPGIYDALSARIAESAGFPAVFLSGSAMGYSQLARPDIGLLTLTDVAMTLDKVTERIGLPVFCDIDSGFGNAINVGRTVPLLERAGAACLQIEDQKQTKLPAEVTARPLVTADEMVDKIRACVDSRRSDETLISARTDAVFTEGIDAAVERAGLYLEAGADLLFVEGVTDENGVAGIRRQFESVPLVYNCEFGGADNTISGETLTRIGFQVQLYPGALIRSMAAAGIAEGTRLARETLGSTESGADSLADLIDAKTFLARYS